MGDGAAGGFVVRSVVDVDLMRLCEVPEARRVA